MLLTLILLVICGMAVDARSAEMDFRSVEKKTPSKPTGAPSRWFDIPVEEMMTDADGGKMVDMEALEKLREVVLLAHSVSGQNRGYL